MTYYYRVRAINSAGKRRVVTSLRGCQSLPKRQLRARQAQPTVLCNESA